MPLSTRPAPSLSRRSFLAALGATTLLGAAGCATTGAPKGATTIRFFNTKPESVSYIREVVATFNASQSDVFVIHDMASDLQASFLRNTPPDIGLLNFNYETVPYIKSGALSDLSDVPEVQRLRPDILALAEQYASYPGRLSVIPWSAAAEGVIYNMDLFEQHGVQVPTSWDELIEVCETLKAAGVTPFYGTFKDGWTVQQGLYDYAIGGSIDVGGFFAQLKAQGADIGPDSPVSFQKDFTGPMTQGLELLKYFNGDAAGQGYGDGNTAFAKGEGAMYLQGPWALGDIAKVSPDLRVGTFPLPMGTAEDRRVRTNLDLGLWIPEASRNKEAARVFLSYLMQQDVIDAFNAKFGNFGTTTDAAPTTDPRIVGAYDFYKEGKFYFGPSVMVPRTIPMDGYSQSLVLGADPKTTFATIDADYARIAFRTS